MGLAPEENGIEDGTHQAGRRSSDAGAPTNPKPPNPSSSASVNLPLPTRPRSRRLRRTLRSATGWPRRILTALSTAQIYLLKLC
ncbi:hypothetical protein GUJ93_ZPchr0006g44625 [Zizania palustris]|uniref:Uncharacterized protein n=1 Tax=Zizania palustris TaxID=103762 RepID=A0A8J5VK04_ZIZPA|nr:hypothetical protein GUJ93_ZPchr0006g44625 [Zizania palustris]